MHLRRLPAVPRSAVRSASRDAPCALRLPARHPWEAGARAARLGWPTASSDRQRELTPWAFPAGMGREGEQSALPHRRAVSGGQCRPLAEEEILHVLLEDLVSFLGSRIQAVF